MVLQEAPREVEDFSKDFFEEFKKKTFVELNKNSLAEII